MSAVPAVSGYCRALLQSDVKEVLAIEQRCYPFPWSKGIFLDCIRTGYHCRVLQLQYGIGAYGIMSVAAQEAHLLNLCSHPDWQRQGLARRLLYDLLAHAKAEADTIFLEVRPSNKVAIHLYHSVGFCELGRRPHYYPGLHGGREDAILMARAL